MQCELQIINGLIVGNGVYLVQLHNLWQVFLQTDQNNLSFADLRHIDNLSSNKFEQLLCGGQMFVVSSYVRHVLLPEWNVEQK